LRTESAGVTTAVTIDVMTAATGETTAAEMWVTGWAGPPDRADRYHGRWTMSDATTETPILDLLGEMTAVSIEASDLDARSLMLVRLGALMAVGAPPGSYLLNLGAAGEAGVTEDDVRGVAAAVAPIVGTARVTLAVGNIARALGFAMELADLDE